MTNIFLIRHTQAEGNIYRSMQGHWDGDITLTGMKQIENLQQRMAEEPIDEVYSSDLYRALITAKLGIADCRNLPVKTDRRLREIDIGPWEAHFFGNLERDHPEETEKFKFDSENYYWPGSETFNDVRERVYEAVEEIAKENDGKTVAIVSHGVSLRCFMSKVCGVDLSDVYTVPICKNTAISKLTYEDGKFNVVFKNDYSHLGKYDPPKWNSTEDISDLPLDFDRDAEYYTSCYEDGWEFAHGGSLEQFNPQIYLACAKKHNDDYPGSVLKLMSKDKAVGLVDLDTERGKDEGYGWISLVYLCPEYRGKGYGVQAMARPMLLYRKLGRQSVRLSVNKDNERAVAFYEAFGFRTIEDDGRLMIMEKKYRI